MGFQSTKFFFLNDLKALKKQHPGKISYFVKIKSSVKAFLLNCSLYYLIFAGQLPGFSFTILANLA